MHAYLKLALPVLLFLLSISAAAGSHLSDNQTINSPKENVTQINVKGNEISVSGRIMHRNSCMETKIQSQENSTTVSVEVTSQRKEDAANRLCATVITFDRYSYSTSFNSSSETDKTVRVYHGGELQASRTIESTQESSEDIKNNGTSLISGIWRAIKSLF